MAQQLGLPPERMHNNIQKVGNTTAASIPLSLSEALLAGRAGPGSLVLFAAFGSGYTWGAGLLRL